VDVSVVIPVYHGAATLPALVPRLLDVLKEVSGDYEVILVDDGSKDGSWEVIAKLHDAYPDRVAAIRLMRNFGQHNALMAGFRATRGEFIVTMDEDLQHPPEEVPKLLEAIQARGLDLVYGTYGDKKHSAWRNLGSALINAFYRLVFRLPVTLTSFRVIRRELLECIFSYSLNYTLIDGLLAWNTDRVGETPVDHQPRAGGRSGYSLGKLVLLALNLFTNFSLLPLQAVSLCGLAAAAVGLAAAVYYLFKYLVHAITVPGFATIIIALLVLVGIQLLALGIMGEYLGRLHLNVNRKPQYSVRKVLRAGPPGAAENGEAREADATPSRRAEDPARGPHP
jgi:undecaprenyl-phosphate 4-deoxy-4-formamido-L-arabinose transferase